VAEESAGAVVDAEEVAVKLQPMPNPMNMKITENNFTMKTLLQIACRSSLRSLGTALLSRVLLSMAFVLASSAEGTETSKTFATPEEAVASLASAVKSKDGDALRAIFGSGVEDIENADRVQATNEFKAFSAALDQTNSLERESADKYVLEVGENSWPFPIPIVRREGRWLFDTSAGEEEILNRRIGKNELEALGVVRAYVGAQREYASQDRNGDGVLEYAQKLTSTPGQTDGLYWPPDLNGEISPLGPLVAEAQEEGYFAAGADHPEPFHGYFFKLLKRQGKHAPGGKYDYVINGHMIGGFGLVAWPAEYDESGIMTFIVNQQGRVYQKDLGPKTEKLVRKMKAYEPDPSWALSPD
jgi:hypothetical protein